MSQSQPGSIYFDLVRLHKEAAKRLSQNAFVQAMTTLETKLKLADDEHIVQTVADLYDVADQLQAADIYGIDTETTGLNVRTPQGDTIVGLGVATDKKAWYIPLFHTVREPQVPIELVREALNPSLSDPRKTAVFHNTVFDWHVLENSGFVRPKTFEDTGLAAHVLNENDSHRLKDLAKKYLHYTESAPFGELFGKLHFPALPLRYSGAYAVKDPKITLRLWLFQQPYLAMLGRLEDVYELEKAVVPVVYAMERTGFRIDLDYLADVKAKVQEEHEDALAAFQAEFPGVNPNSPKQLQELMYEQMGLAPKDKKRATDRGTIKAYLKDAPTLQRILDIREISKLLGTYVDPLLEKHVNGRIHGGFKQLGAATGRFSSSDPNLQNIPASHGSLIRGAFIPDPGFKLISVDYSQVELRILAHMSQEPSMLDAYRTGKDLHTATAAKMFGIPYEQVDPNGKERKRAKTINFGIIYGQTEIGLSESLGVTEAEAAEILEQYFASMPVLREWLDAIVRQGVRVGYVETILGRKRRLPDLQNLSPKKPAWHHAARQAKNAPIQGSSADITKKALVACYNDPQLQEWGVQILSTVHDEIIFQAPEAVAEIAGQRAKRLMENVVTLSVPLVCDVAIMDRWTA
ncbi:MAG: hypothetical protein K6V97_06665 [Actinomycetia bacterium]|nr:hypothetical protein [Actinomycetes bacterium]